MTRKVQMVAGLDLGTSTITAVVGQPGEHHDVDILGVGVVESEGIRRGAVIGIDAATDAIRRAVAEAELAAGVEIDSASISLSGQHVDSCNSRGVVTVAGRTHEVSQHDVRRALEAARGVRLQPGWDILQVLPQEFLVDAEAGISDPVGVTGTRLEASAHVLSGNRAIIQTLVRCVNRAGVVVREPVPASLAAGEAVLTEDDKDMGVALVDIGGGTTDVAIYERGAVWHTGVVPVGGMHFTQDVAANLRMPVREAESLKRRLGAALTSLVGETERMDVVSVGGCPDRMLPRRFLARILQARAEDLFERVLALLTEAGHERLLNSGVVLTGGGACLTGMVEAATRMFDVPVRLGEPQGVGGLADHTSSPACATAVGLLLGDVRQRANVDHPQGTGMLGRLTHRLEGALADFF